MSTVGRIKGISISKKKGTRKANVSISTLISHFGLDERLSLPLGQMSSCHAIISICFLLSLSEANILYLGSAVKRKVQLFNGGRKLRAEERETILRWDEARPDEVTVWTAMRWAWERLEKAGHEPSKFSIVGDKVIGKEFIISKRQARALFTKGVSKARIKSTPDERK